MTGAAEASHGLAEVLPYEDALARTGGDEFVRWQIDPARMPEAYAVGDAVAFERLNGTLVVLATPTDAARCVRTLVAPRRPTRVTVPRGTLPLLGRDVRVGEGAEWEWMLTDTPPPVLPAAKRVSVLTSADDAAITALLAVASPRHSADPGDDDVVQWVGVRDSDGALVACAAHTEAVAGVPHLASIATHPAARGHGLGALVTGTLIRQVLLDGAPVVTLGMYSDNDIARRMYLRLGFRCNHLWSSYGILLLS